MVYYQTQRNFMKNEILSVNQEKIWPGQRGGRAELLPIFQIKSYRDFAQGRDIYWVDGLKKKGMNE